MTRHVALPARRSSAPGQWVSVCVAPGCRLPFHDTDRHAAYEAAKAHCATENDRDDAADSAAGVAP